MKKEKKMKTIKGNRKQVIIAVLVMMTFGLGLGVAYAEDAPLFHIVTAADSAADPDSYVGGTIGAVTDQLGAPSAAWFDPEDDTLINYIYVGESVVLTFHVLKEGKTVSAVVTDPRRDWENGVCPAYPKCPTTQA